MITSNKLILTTKDVIPTNTYKNLISGKTSAVIIQNFLTKHRCKKIIRDIAIYEASSGCGIKEKIGESINSYVSNKSEYFTKTKISNYYLRKIFSYNDPRKIMFEKISKLLHGKIKFARENSMPYSEGIIRFHIPGESVHIHRDNASFDASEFSVSKLSGQISAILHLQSSELGGELVIFDKFWNCHDECFRNQDFGYSDKIIKKISWSSISCNQGDLVIINPKKYHLINMVRGKLKRITLGFFLGQESESNFHAWS